MYPNIKITQKLGIFESNRLEIIGNTEIEITYKGFFKSQTGRIPLGVINPNPVNYKKVNVKALFLSILCFLVVVACVFGYLQGLAKDAGVFIVLGAVFGVFALLVLNSCLKSSVQALIFHNIENGANLFALFPNKNPNSEVDTFTNALAERIKSIRYPENLSLVQKWEVYHKHLNYLFSENVITDQELNTILSRIKSENKKAEIIKLV
ncbi:hypothetical protein Sden_2065 [Shewanella denitrificans OS217]|jgi:hypothetical protein|uniref:Uncharacterized protein n=1 Tax=Shewanella denitrificans (strain OS217 / ATCC BAA-1090 / DSM 15013) TaxID=318161 RepID=Q12MH9_SHEDO|nr:hypothetical protein [Shewanella denitrificans]ABE55347.1 hypothetical protein Sden_2065 [Shewanella denitrificans OS217]